MSNFEDLKKIEEKINSIKLEINSLYSEDNCDELFKAKANSLQNELYNLQQELNNLNRIKNSTYVQQTIQKKTYIQREIPKMPTVPKKELSFEQFLGKNLMGIIASILIFIGVVFFAALVLPYLGEVPKFLLMMVFSIGLLTFGSLKLRKEVNNLYLSVSGCGLGAVFISLFIGNIYFKMIPDIPLFIALLAWMAIVFYLSRYKSTLFIIIGEVGLLVSVVFSMFMQFESLLKPTMILVYILICQGSFLLFKKNENDFGYIFQVIVNNIILLTYSFCMYFNFFSSGIDFLGVINIALITIIWGICYIVPFIRDNYSLGTKIFSTFFNFLMFIGIISIVCFDSSWAFILILSITSIVCIEKYFTNNNHISLKYLFSAGVTISLFLLLAAGMKEFGLLYFFLLFTFYGAMFLYGRVVNDEYKIISLSFLNILNVIGIFEIVEFSSYFYVLSYMIFAFIIEGIICYFINNTDEKYVCRNCFYMLPFLTILCFYKNCISFVDDNQIFVIFCFVLTLVIEFLFKFINLINNKTALNINLTINGICMGLLSSLILDSSYNKVVLIVLAIFFFSLNLSNIVRTYGNKFCFYIGFKYLVLIALILNTLDAISVVYSIVFLIISIVFIVIGMKLRIKEFRLFGLILSLFSISKLVLFDISYENATLRAFSFIVCGILCFLISFLYNKLEQKINID